VIHLGLKEPLVPVGSTRTKGGVGGGFCLRTLVLVGLERPILLSNRD
jgi:hypothetical protein